MQQAHRGGICKSTKRTATALTMMDIAKKMQEYDEAFDFYMDRGRMPDTISPTDPLGGFLTQTLHDNPQLDSQDPLWKDLLKDELMKFLEAMLQLFQPLEEQHRKEKEFIHVFLAGSMDKKRQIWSQAKNIIVHGYSQKQVNLNGYEEQLKKTEPQDTQTKEAILTSLVKDWDKACDEKLKQQEQASINQRSINWEMYVKEHGLSDYKKHKRIEKIVYSYPELAEIVRIMGREQPNRKDEMDETVKKYLPILPSPPKPATEIEEIATGQSLRHMMPVETAIMSDRKTEDLFYLKYATQKLQLFASKPKEESWMKLDRQRQKEPRLEKGPMIVSLDTSGSMSGRPIQLAQCLLLQLLKMAKKQKRKCFLISFSVRANVLDLSRYGAWRQLDKFLANYYSGGTDGEEMLAAALKTLKNSNFAMADVLIISDFYFSQPTEPTQKKMKMEHDKGTRFYGLQINSSEDSYNNILDKIWQVKTRNHNFG